MVRKVKAVSITEELAQFLEENPNLSPSKILQTAIEEIRASYINTDDMKGHMLELHKRIEFLQERLQKYSKFLEERGLTEEILKVI
jgi:hypothetical protein